MKERCDKQHKKHRRMLQGKCIFIVCVFFWFAGCSIWNEDLDPDYKSSRADRLCHPYGQCSQGSWVSIDGTAKDPILVKTQCDEVVDQRYGNGWWADSVARGLEIGSCMEKHGFRLRQ